MSMVIITASPSSLSIANPFPNGQTVSFLLPPLSVVNSAVVSVTVNNPGPADVTMDAGAGSATSNFPNFVAGIHTETTLFPSYVQLLLDSGRIVDMGLTANTGPGCDLSNITLTLDYIGSGGGGGGGGGTTGVGTGDTDSGYDPIDAVTGSGLGCCSSGRIPLNCKPTTTFNDAATAVTANSATLVFVARNDRNMISLVDTITPCFVSCMRYYCHPAQFVQGIAKRAAKCRVVRMIVYGSGVVTDGTLTVVADNRYTETYPAVSALSPEPGVLFYQEFTNAMVGTSIAPDFVLSGFGLDITDVEFEGVRIDS